MRNRALVVWILVVVAMTLLAGCGGGGGGSSDNTGATDTTAPTVSSTSPANGSAGVAMNSSIAATFSEGMDASTVTTATFTLKQGDTAIAGTVMLYNGTTATFTPSANLSYSTTYTATITTGAKDAAGNALASNYTWTFITGTGATFKIPDTGQTTSYTNTFGEDHDYTINPPSYTDNENGTIIDNVTSLMWQKEDDNTERTWYDAVSYCNALALGGNSDWRLPTKRELISIVDYGKYNPAINTTFFPNTDTDSYYWSSTTYSTNSAWMVRFYSGYLNTPSKSNSYYVRCVSGDGEPIAKSVTNNGNGTITDNITELMWQEAQGGSMTWEAGLTYCENLSLTGYNDWRLPNIKELESISGNGLNFSGYFWSSTTDMQQTTAAWRLYYDAYVWDGTNSIKQDSNNIRCVRGGQVSAPDVTPPTVTSTNPANNATEVAVNSAITATFSETMDSSSITTATFYVGGVSGTVTYSGTTATFTPSSNLSYSTTYTATITTGAKDAAGNAVASNYTWTFTTGSATAVSGTIKLPKTGQTTSYTTGDDGNLQRGVAWPTPRFTNLDSTTPITDNVVVDRLTGLMWTKDGNAPGPAACGPAMTKAWLAAIDYVACLNINSYLGYTDWRLPNREELRSLVNYGQSNMATWLNTQGFANVQALYYWSSSTYQTSFAYGVDMLSGALGNTYANKYNSLNVWPVRTAPGAGVVDLPRTGQTTSYATGDDGNLQRGVAWPTPRFTNPDGTTPITDNVVVDRLTGLMWTKDGNAPGPAACSPGAYKTWQGALDYVACLNANSYLGYTDWRLPSIHEQASLVNIGAAYAFSSTWLASQGFSNVQTWYMSSTKFSLISGNSAWGVYMQETGLVVPDFGTNAADAYPCWPVRGGQGSAPDITPPTVSSTNPTSNATGVAVNSFITATFSEPMNASTITTQPLS